MKETQQKRPVQNGDEYDALTSQGKQWYKHRAGACKWMKRKYNKRFRKAWKHERTDDSEDQ